MEKILVIGATGFLGAHLTYKILSKRYSVRALKRRDSDTVHIKKIFKGFYNDETDLFSKIEWVEGDIRDYDSLLEALQGITIVYNCAGVVSFEGKKNKNIIEVNVQGTRNLLDAMEESGTEKLCHVSSVAALGECLEGQQVNEICSKFVSINKSFYAWSKLESEILVWQAIEDGLKAVIVNPSVILGPWKWDQGSAKMFAVVDKGMKFYTTGITGYVDVRDVAEIMVTLMDKAFYGERYVVCSENLSYQYILEKIAKHLGAKSPSQELKRKYLKILYNIDKLISIFRIKKPLLTKEMVKASTAKTEFSNKKVVDQLDYKFKKIEHTIDDTCTYYLKDKQHE